MFEQSMLAEKQPRARWTVAAAFLGQVVALAVVVAIPVLSVQQLPLAELTSVLIAPPPLPPPPPPPPPPMAARAGVARLERTAPRFDAGRLIAPKAVPQTIPSISSLPQAPAALAAAGAAGGADGGVAGGQIGGVLGGVLGGVPSLAPPPPPPPPPAAAPPSQPAPGLLRVGGAVQAAKVISAPPPDYPVLAKQAHVSGAVRLGAIIGPDGHIQDLKVVSGSPLLVDAVVQAVKSWTYQPTILNGKPVKVATEIVVNFTLA